MTKQLKPLILITLLFFTVSTFAQSVINGKVVGVKENLYISYGYALYSIDLKDNKFTYQLPKAQSPQCIGLAQIKGSKVKHLSPEIWITADTVNIEFNISKAGNTYKMDKRSPHQSISEQIQSAPKGKKMQLIEKNLNVYPALFFLYKNKEKFSLKKLKAIYPKIPQKFKEDILAQRLKGYITAKQLSVPKKNKQFRTFQLKDKNGKLIKIETKANKYRLLIFMSYGCFFSRMSVPKVAKLQKKYAEKVDFISIWNIDSNEMWQDKEIAPLLTWTNLWDKNEFVFTYFDINLYPSFYLVDKNGKIITILKNYEKLGQMLKKHLK